MESQIGPARKAGITMCRETHCQIRNTAGHTSGKDPEVAECGSWERHNVALRGSLLRVLVLGYRRFVLLIKRELHDPAAE